jgi:hypothetical protein
MLVHGSNSIFGVVMRGFENGYQQLYAYAKSLACVGLLFGALVGSTVNAQTVVPASAFENFMATATGVGKQTVAFSSSGQPVISPGVPSLATDGTAKALMSRSGSITNPSGVKVPITASARVAAAGAGALIKKALPLLPWIGVGVAIYDFIKEMGYDAQTGPNGVTVTKPDPTVCTVAPCTGYKGRQPGVFVADPLQAAINVCSYYYGPPVAPYPYFVQQVNGTWGGPGWKCSQNISESLYTGSMPPQVAQNIPATLDDLANSIASKSGWPSTSKLAPALRDAAQLTGDKIPLESPTVTGPTTSHGPTSTTQNPDGTTTTKTTVHNHNYQGDTITTTNVTTTNNYNPSTNITTTTTTTETPDPAKTDCEKNPNAVGCKTLDDVPLDKVPTRTETITWAEENLGFGAGSCPAPIPWHTSLVDGQISFQSYCDGLVTYVRPVIILLAFLAAFFIVAPVREGT